MNHAIKQNAGTPRIILTTAVGSGRLTTGTPSGNPFRALGVERALGDRIVFLECLPPSPHAGEGRKILAPKDRRIGPRLDWRASPAAVDNADGHAKLACQFARDEVADGGEFA